MPTTRGDVVHGFGTLAIVLDGLRGEISIAELVVGAKASNGRFVIVNS